MSKVCQTAYLEIRRILSIRKCLTTEATKPPVSSLVTSRLDYCNSLFAGVPQKHVAKLQRAMNCAACLVCRASKCEPISPLLADLHWLPVSHRIKYKIVTVCYNVILGSVPPYLADILQLSLRSLCSPTDSRTFRIPIKCKKFQGRPTFSYTGFVIWNNLPFSDHHAQILSRFKSQLIFKHNSYSSVQIPVLHCACVYTI